MQESKMYIKPCSNFKERAKITYDNNFIFTSYKMPDKFAYTDRIEKLFKSINRKFHNTLSITQPDEKLLRAECGIFDVKFKTACRIGGWKY